MLFDTIHSSAEIQLSSAVTANQLEVTAWFVDITATDETPGKSVTLTNGTTPVQFIAPPGASTARKANAVTVFNADTVTAVVSIRYNENSSIFRQVRVSVPSGSTLHFSDVTNKWEVVAGQLLSVAWGSINGTLSAQTDLAAALAKVAVNPIGVACSDETTALTTGTAKVTFRMPYAMTVSAVRATLTTAQTSGSIFTVDINESGTSILSTKLTIDNGEKTSTTAATPPVISDSSLADDAEITIDIDQVGDGTAKGLKVWIIGAQT